MNSASICLAFLILSVIGFAPCWPLIFGILALAVLFGALAAMVFIAQWWSTRWSTLKTLLLDPTEGP